MNRRTTSATKRRRERTRRVPVTVRLPAEIVRKIDRDLEHRLVPVSRNNWLLEAAIQKLNGDGSRGSHGKE
jgi:hypothetical protein